MADNGRSGSASGSPEEMGFVGNYPNGQRSHFAGLDKSGSFRGSSESRMFGSGPCSNRASIASTPGSSIQLSQFLALDPLTLGEHKYNGSGELRRILGSSFGSAADCNSLGAAHQSKHLPAAAAEEIKHIKASLVDDSLMSRGFSKHVDGLIHNVNKYQEVSSSKKYQRNESLPKERSSGSNLSKMGTQLQRNTPESASQRPQDKAKNVVLNKRVRTSVEIRGEGRSNELIRQSLSVAKERDLLKEGSAGSDMFEEKIRKLPAGREGWDKRMKKKRSVGSVSMRSGDDDADIKRAAHLKLSNESSMQLCEGQGFRSGSLDGTSGNGINKFDNPSFSACSSARGTAKNEPEKASLPKEAMAGLNKERIIAKGSNKFSLQDGNHAVNLGSVTKGKSSRSPRTGPVAVGSTIPSISRSSGMLDGWEQPPNVNKLQDTSAVNNRKRPLPGGSASSPITQWVGQRPHKISRTRRANLVSPVQNNDDLQPSSEGGSPDFGTRMTSSATSGSLLSRGSPNGLQQLRVKLENVSSPARLSESEDSGIGENKIREQAVGSCDGEERSPNVGPTSLLTKKNKIFVREVGDGVRRQGRTGRGSQVSKATIAPTRDKQENHAPLKPGRNMRPGSDKNGSKSGRPPLKKHSDRKLTRLGQIPSGSSPDFPGDIDDDHGELVVLAEFARSASYLACSNSFWKKMERMLGRLSLADISYIGHQLKHSEELYEGLSQMFGTWDNDLGDLLHEKTSLLQNLVSGESERSLITDVVSKGYSRSGDFIDGFQDNGTLYGRTDGKGSSKDVPPLYQRVLSALIIEDDPEEFDETCGEGEVSFRYAGVNSPSSAQLHVDIERRDRDDMEFEYDPTSLHVYRQCATDKSSCNGSYILDRGAGNNSPSCNSELFQGDNSIDSDEEYEQLNLEDKLLLELHSIGIYPDSVPDLAEGEDEVINQEIFGLRRELNQLVGNKKLQLGKTYKVVHETKEVEGRHLEQIAMDRLTEVTYKKHLVPRGGSASKSSSKVSKPLALAFVKRALARCHMFENTGESCFADPTIREVLLAPPPCINDVEPMHSDVATDDCRSELRMSGSYPTYSAEQAFAKSGPASNRGKKKEMLLDDVSGSAAARASLISGNSLLGGAKGKRSERERDSSVVKAGRPSMSNCKGERKTKSKPKQKAAELTTSGNGFFASPTYPLGPNETVMASSDSKRKVGLPSPGNNLHRPSKESNEPLDFANLPIPDLDSIEDLGVGEHQDLGSWLSFDEDGLQDMDLMGLEIPMDDLSQLNMF